MPSILAPNHVTRSHLGGGGEGAEHLPKLRDGFGVIGNQNTGPVLAAIGKIPGQDGWGARGSNPEPTD